MIWDVTTGKRVTEIGDEADIVLAADVSPDHKLVALGGPGKLIKIYDTATGELRHKIKKHTDWVTAMEFSPDGEMLATGDRNGGAYVWEAETGRHRVHARRPQGRDHRPELAGRLADAGLVERGRPRHPVVRRGRLPDAVDQRPGRRRRPRQRPQQAARRAVGAVRPQRPARHLRPRQHGPRLEGRTAARSRGWKASPTCPSRAVFSHDGERVFVGDFTGKIRVWTLKDSKPVGELTTNPGS